MVMAEVCTAVGMGWEPDSRAGVAFLFLGCEESKGVSRPKERPTAEAPTTVAVAQSCITEMGQSWRLVRLAKEVYRGETGKVQPLSETRASEASRHIKTTQGPQQWGRAIQGTRRWTRAGDYRWNSFHSR